MKQTTTPAVEASSADDAWRARLASLRDHLRHATEPASRTGDPGGDPSASFDAAVIAALDDVAASAREMGFPLEMVVTSSPDGATLDVAEVATLTLRMETGRVGAALIAEQVSRAGSRMRTPLGRTSDWPRSVVREWVIEWLAAVTGAGRLKDTIRRSTQRS